jgi:cell division protein FtsZ
MAKTDVKLNGQAPVSEVERIRNIPELDMESFASMPVEDLDRELRQLGLDPDEPLPGRLTKLISVDERISAPRRPEEVHGDKLPIRILVVGVGGAGGNVVSRMIESGVKGVEFVAVNTDVQALNYSRAELKVQIGGKLTQGRGAGGDARLGLNSALEDTERLYQVLEGADLVFLTGGLGGGTGTGALPVLASLAGKFSALTVAVVTKPFQFEGKRRMLIAEQGLSELCECADTVIAIPNERLISSVGKNATLFNSFKVADEVLHQAVQGISELITIPGYINLDFADVKTIMSGMGLAWMGLGCASGEKRALEATRQVISSPLFEEETLRRAKGVLINITGGTDLTLYEVNEASSLIRETADENANIIFGTVIDESLHGEIRITVIATGFDKEAEAIDTPTTVVEQQPQQVTSRYTPVADLRPSHPDASVRPDVLEVPTFIRRKRAT